MKNFDLQAVAQKFKPSFQDIKFLFIYSWNLIKDNPILRKPFYALVKINIIFLVISFLIFVAGLIYSSIIAIASVTTVNHSSETVLTPNLLMYILPVILFFWVIFIWNLVFAFIKTKQQGRFALMIYKTESNIPFTQTDIDTEIASVHVKLREITWASLLESVLNATLRGKWGFLAIFVSLFLAALQEVWDLMRNYLIPAVVIEKKETWKETADTFRTLQTKIPQTLVWVFGIDFWASAFGWVVGFIKFLFLVLGGLIVYWLSFFGVSTVFLVILFLVFLVLVWIFSSVQKIAFEMVKVMYFTLLYTSLNHPEILEKNPEIQKYLTFDSKY